MMLPAWIGDTSEPAPYAPGDVIQFYPRQGKPGHDVTIIECRRHVFHRWIVRFRYNKGGRVQERTILKFFTSPD